MSELLKYLKKNLPENIITGEDGSDLLILGDGTKHPTEVRLILLVIGFSKNDRTFSINDDLYQIFTVALNNVTKSRLYRVGKRLSEVSKIPFVIIAYKNLLDLSKVNEQILDSMTFITMLVYPKNKSNLETLRSSDELVDYLYSLMGVKYVNSGTRKPVNSKIADMFHCWSRAKLSPDLVKQDIDAIFDKNDKIIMLEIKRSPKISVENWTPFKNDFRNYEILDDFSKKVNSKFYTLHHNGYICEDTSNIGCYEIQGVNDENDREWLNYEKSIICASDLIKLLNGTEKK